MGVDSPTPSPGRSLLRRLLSGQKVTKARDNAVWTVAPAARPTGGAKANPDHPSRKHDTDLRRSMVFVPLWPPTQSAPRRRDRRPAMIRVAREERDARHG